jgi:hypothetical protein
MTCDRMRAHVRVMRALSDGASRLRSSEQARIRVAANSLLFCADLVNDRSASAAFADFEALHGQLVADGRWTAERAQRLAHDLRDCGPRKDAEGRRRHHVL